ncbi:MAG: asparagine synthase (glutamine-hydrolyzing) [Deltaproteobacteria bacterium]|nr:asparagine synthase (glutamine-hydrolyzing) [Deltaproteobacteria bacterium]
MCGIFAVITPGKPVDVETCFRSVSRLSHRGPDGSGIVLGSLREGRFRFFLNPTMGQLTGEHGACWDVFLGHRRLSIIDLSNNAYQPMGNEDETIWVVFNGEIYNHSDLRRELLQYGHRFATDHSDTEVLVHGYEEWGSGILDRIRGMFAFALLDYGKGSVLLARDHFGKKPLYVYNDTETIAWASELKALSASRGTDNQISSDALLDFLRLGYIPAPRTIHSRVSKLKAAEAAELNLASPSDMRRFTYWNLEYRPEYQGDEDRFGDEFSARLRESVRLRMISDVPLGAFLSGGIDSSSIVKAMSGLSDRPVRTFTIGFNEREYDESVYATRVSEHYKAEHHSRTITPQRLLEYLPRLSEIFDEPFADSSALPTLVLCEMTRQLVTVALTGDGGDELLAGYTRYAVNLTLGRIFDNVIGGSLSKCLSPLTRFWPDHVKGKGVISLFHPDPRLRYEELMGSPWLVKHSLLRPSDGPFDMRSIWDFNAPSTLDRMCKADIRLYVPEDLMVKVDRTSMAVSLEARCPFLDHELFEFVSKSPTTMRFRGGNGKIPLRRVLARDLGRSFVERPKKGFAVPLGHWFRKELREELSDILCSSSSFVSTLFPNGFLPSLLKAHQHGSRNLSNRIWPLLVLEKWHRTYGGSL